MRPIERAMLKCKEKGVSFNAIFEHYMGNASSYLISTPDCFALGKPANFGEGRHGWFLALAAGNLPAIMAQLPYEMPFLGFYRDGNGPLRVYPWARFKKLAARVSKS